MMNRENGRFRGVSFISLTFLVGFMLTIIPLPKAMIWYRPSFILLILIFWLIHQPYSVGIIVAWCVGLLLDVLSGSLLGVHAFIFTLIAYFLLNFHQRMRNFSVGQELLMVLMIELIHLSIQYLISFYFDAEPDTWRYWIPTLTTVLFWPVIVLLLTTRKRLHWVSHFY